jgi:hypothetical protein
VDLSSVVPRSQLLQWRRRQVQTSAPSVTAAQGECR